MHFEGYYCFLSRCAANRQPVNLRRHISRPIAVIDIHHCNPPLEKLPLHGYKIKIGRVQKAGLDAFAQEFSIVSNAESP